MMAKKYRAKQDRYASDVDFFDVVYDASWRQKKTFGNRIDAARDNVHRVNSERAKADPGVYVSGAVYKVPQKRYKRK